MKEHFSFIFELDYYLPKLRQNSTLIIHQQTQGQYKEQSSSNIHSSNKD